MVKNLHRKLDPKMIISIEFKQDYNITMEVTALPPSFDLLKNENRVHDSLSLI
jgi:hypothetical protein